MIINVDLAGTILIIILTL